MITEQDLQEAIAECQGQKNPNANTCLKLAAYYTIRNELYGKSEHSIEPVSYSRAEKPDEQISEHPEEYVDFYSGTAFSETVNGMISAKAWAVMDELMDILQATNHRLYSGVIQKLEDA